jgi:hypothetical protein
MRDDSHSFNVRFGMSAEWPPPDRSDGNTGATGASSQTKTP